ncbi:Hypothetical protein FKW44_016700, partial [Caligus rogercresseyi]
GKVEEREEKENVREKLLSLSFPPFLCPLSFSRPKTVNESVSIKAKLQISIPSHPTQ